jgi:hypothetical protein
MNWLMPLVRREKTKSIVHHSIATYKCYDPSWSEAGSDCHPCALVVIVVIAVLAVVVEVGVVGSARRDHWHVVVIETLAVVGVVLVVVGGTWSSELHHRR